MHRRPFEGRHLVHCAIIIIRIRIIQILKKQSFCANTYNIFNYFKNDFDNIFFYKENNRLLFKESAIAPSYIFEELL